MIINLYGFHHHNLFCLDCVQIEYTFSDVKTTLNRVRVEIQSVFYPIYSLATVHIMKE